MKVPSGGYDFTEIRRRIDHLVSIAETLAHGDPASQGMERLYAEVEQLAAAVHDRPRPSEREPVSPPRQRGGGVASTYPADYWFG